MKLIRNLLLYIICAALIFGMVYSEYIPVYAAGKDTATYVALGDSITTGYGLVNFNVNDAKNKASSNNFVNKLSKKLGKKAVNLGVEGLDSTRFLKSIATPQTAEQKAAVAEIKKAGIITISIGGNNVMLPMLETLNEKLGKGKNIFTASSDEIEGAIFSLIFDTGAIDNLKNNVLAGAVAFNGDAKTKQAGDFANIISTIKKLNPKAQVIVQTIYNPYRLPFTVFFDDAIKSMNAKIIKDSANGKNYKVADVYSAFLKASSDSILVNADKGETFDPHPTAKGHEIMYTLMAYAAQNNTLPYKIKTTITKGKLTSNISEGELIFTISPDKGYKAPQSISLTIGKNQARRLVVKSGKAVVAISDINSDFTVTGVCTK